MASVYKRGKYYWIEFADQAGRRVQRCLWVNGRRVTDRLIAERERVSAELTLRQGAELHSKNQDPALWLEAYLSEVRLRVVPGHANNIILSYVVGSAGEECSKKWLPSHREP